MATLESKQNVNPKIQLAIWAVSIVVPALVAFLLFNKMSFLQVDMDLSFFPKFHALLNTTVFALLIAALVAIKSKNEKLHRSLMMGALMLSVVFLVSYVAYHSMGTQVYFGDYNLDQIVTEEEALRAGKTTGIIYKFVLLSHILLSVVVVPLVLFAVYHIVIGNREKHLKIVKWAYPIWFYVAVTGPIVYLLIKPFYPWNL